MNAEMSHVGELFRYQREKMKLSLREVEKAISIRKFFLEAIEEGKIHEFIASVYALGFMKQYAQFLDLDIEGILKEHPKAFTMQTMNQDFCYGIGTLEKRGKLRGGLKWLPNLMWSVGIVGIIVLAYYFCKAIGI